MTLSELAPKKKTVALSLVLLFASSLMAAPAVNSPDADNTKLNQRDSSGHTLTPEDQAKGSDADVELTRKIRQQLVEDESLSTDAHNIKIITLNGVVTLRGPVASQAERAKVNELAKKMAGVKKVDNKTEIKTKTY